MKKLAVYRFLYALRHNLPVLLLYLAGGYLLSSILFTFTVGNLLSQYVWQHNIELPDLSAQSERKARLLELLYTVMTDNYNLLLCEAMLVLLVVVWLIARRLPLALPKALYVCPAGPREKLRYLRIYLTVKAVFLALLLAALTLFWTGTLILPAPVLAVQVSLTVFTVIAFSLNPDPGNRKEALKKCPDRVTEKSSQTVVNVYWSGLLLLENTVFYACMYALPSFGWLTAACWIPALLINIWIAKKHLTPVLCTMLDYEKIYYPLPDDGSAGPQ